MLKDFNGITPGIWIVNSSSILNPPFATPKSGLAVAFAGTDNLVRMTLFVSYNTDFVVIRGSIGSDWKRLVWWAGSGSILYPILIFVQPTSGDSDVSLISMLSELVSIINKASPFEPVLQRYS